MKLIFECLLKNQNHAFPCLPLPVNQSKGIVITSPGERGEPVIDVSPRLGFIVITEKTEYILKWKHFSFQRESFDGLFWLYIEEKRKKDICEVVGFFPYKCLEDFKNSINKLSNPTMELYKSCVFPATSWLLHRLKCENQHNTQTVHWQYGTDKCRPNILEYSSLAFYFLESLFRPGDSIVLHTMKKSSD